jgi:hypothetical protein
MGHFSIAGIDLTVTRLPHPGGVRGNQPELFEVSNCEWTAEIEARSGVPGIVARFRSGKQPKYEHELREVWPFLVMAFAEPDHCTRVLHAMPSPAPPDTPSVASTPMDD